VLLTSVLFGAIHGNVPQGVWAFILGCFVHLAYLATRSLWVPMLLHFVEQCGRRARDGDVAGFRSGVVSDAGVRGAGDRGAVPCAWMLYDAASGGWPSRRWPVHASLERGGVVLLP